MEIPRALHSAYMDDTAIAQEGSDWLVQAQLIWRSAIILGFHTSEHDCIRIYGVIRGHECVYAGPSLLLGVLFFSQLGTGQYSEH